MESGVRTDASLDSHRVNIECSGYFSHSVYELYSRLRVLPVEIVSGFEKSEHAHTQGRPALFEWLLVHECKTESA